MQNFTKGKRMSKNSNFGECVAIIVIIVMMCIAVLITFAMSGTTTEFEYETVNGETGIAKYCKTPFRGVPYCRLDDGTRIYSIKKYKYKRTFKKEKE